MQKKNLRGWVGKATESAVKLRAEGRNAYKIKVYVHHGYFRYWIPEMSSALEHAGLIMERGVYRRSRPDGAVEFHKVIKVKVEGEGLGSEYPDTFVRT
jgi:hypothetical protein